MSGSSTSATCASHTSRASARLEVQPQQRLGVGRPQVEPPVAEVDGEAVEAVLVGVGGYARGDALDHGARGRRTCVLISPDAA